MKFKFIIVLLCLITSSLAAQTGEIKGTIIDQDSGEPLVGASVAIAQTSIGAAANSYGKFSIQNLKTGEYELEISFVGFEKLSKKVMVTEGSSTQVELSLKPSALSLGDVQVTQNLAQNASTISALDIELRPISTSQDVLKIVPGLFIAQHAGGGKAEQIFLRGFDIDHGTDIALSVDGMPVNMVSHAHGQGYSDLHFVIPETIERVAFDKGPYYANKGDFNTAGFAAFSTKKRLESNLFKVEGGQFGTFRTVGLFNLLEPKTTKDPSLYLATEYFRTNGYFESSQNFNRFNTLLKYHQRLSDNKTLELSTSAFTSSWDASGQIPIRAIESGQISRFGAIDDTEGGNTSRVNLNAKLTTDLSDGGIIENQVFMSKYDFKLVSNFTFFLNDPINGDQITQSEDRQIYGSNNSYWNNWSLFGLKASTEFGTGFRYDQVNDIRLSRTLNRREILSDLARGDIRESSVYFYAEEQLDLTKRLSLTAGLRYDYFTFDYVDALTPTYNRQVENKGILTPKFKLSYEAGNNLNIYVKSGIGYHSNDTRVVVAQNGSDILPKAYGVDLGTLWKPTENLLVNVALWRLDLAQEFVYVGDEGVVEAGGKTQRQGVDLTVRYQLTPSLYANMDLNYTDPKSVDEAEGQDYIPLAPTFTSIGGLNYEGKKGFRGSLRYRYLDDRAANEDNSVVAKGYFLMDAVLNYEVGAFDFGIAVENVLNTEWREAQFDTESRLRNEAQSVSEIHFTPGTPFQARLSVAVKF
ncbi:TonB-dependent receptor [Roseivirga seohaensis subsp. aquiponti]|uniref:TonB-dependent receptor n=1 Tax=Roseivirga seohaensis subsp. aquiponti TaxID=1566026 RepID=A0A0L8AN74_9BACT|nr:TonB-dependent receptor [Roseivirga seohaensis]KOF03769.1 TonB-dependent receptor [Roseivirga seohaensis subsp. aquiponti]